MPALRFVWRDFNYNLGVMNEVVNVIGGGLAGVEAAWQAAEPGAKVRLFEMRPVHADAGASDGQAGGDRLFELAENGRAGLGSLSFKGRAASRAFAGDGGGRGDEGARGSGIVGRPGQICRTNNGDGSSAHPNIEIVREEVTSLPNPASGTLALQSIIATGPLTCEALTA